MKPNDRELSDIFRLVRDEDAALAASSDVEGRLRAEVGSIAHARRRRAAIVILAAAAVLAIAVTVPWRRGASNSTEATTVRTQANPAPAEIATAFFPLAYSSMPVSNPHLVRLEVPHAALAAFGLAPTDIADTRSGTVQADVLVGEDGVARAVRFVSP